MSNLFTGSWGVALALLCVVGLPLQLAFAGLMALGRKVPAFLTLLIPMLVLLIGLFGTMIGVEDAIDALGQASDPAWAPWFALDDRARAAWPAVTAGAGAALLALPVAVGAAFAARRPPRPPSRSRALAFVWITLPIAFGVLVALAGLAVAATVDGGRILALPGVGGFPFLLGAVLASSVGDPRRLGAVAAGGGALVVGVGGLALCAAAFSGANSAWALGDFSKPFETIGSVVVTTREARSVALWSAGFATVWTAAAVPIVLVRDWRRIEASHGLDAFVVGALVLLLLSLAGWATMRQRVLTHVAGAHAALVLASAAGYDVPAQAVLPARVLVGTAATPRWLRLGTRGGADVLPVAGGLEIVGPSILRDDGLMLDPKVSLEDFYLGLFESSAGSVAIVGCSRANPELQADIAADPLMALGRCSAFPLGLRVTTKLPDPRVLIVLKDRYVDDAGDVFPFAEVKDIAGRDVILRAQTDATVGDLVAALPILAPAARVYLGFGITPDGDDLPIGVDPGLRISKLPQEVAAEAATAEAAPAETP